MAEAKNRPVEVRARELLIRLAETPEEIEASQRLRYQIFVEEMSAQPTDAQRESKMEFDYFDEFCDHLLVFDLAKGGSQDGDPTNVVGTYRFMRRAAAEKAGRFYTSDEYDISPLLKLEGELMELGRSGVHKDYRTGAIITLLWKGIADYVFHFDVELMFGCASLPDTDPAKLAAPLSFLYHKHLAPPELRVRALPERFVDMNMMPLEYLDEKEAQRQLPPLLKGYLRLGGFIGDGAVVDAEFGTTDVCLILKTDWASERYRKHYTRDE